MAKLMDDAAPASALITGKAFAAGGAIGGTGDGVVALAYLLGVHMTVNPGILGRGCCGHWRGVLPRVYR